MALIALLCQFECTFEQVPLIFTHAFSFLFAYFILFFSRYVQKKIASKHTNFVLAFIASLFIFHLAVFSVFSVFSIAPRVADLNFQVKDSELFHIAAFLSIFILLVLWVSNSFSRIAMVATKKTHLCIFYLFIIFTL